MEFVNYLIAAFIVFLGPFAGAALAMIAPEEFNTGKKYFILFKSIMYLLAILAAVGFTIYSGLSYLIAVLMAILITALFVKKHRDIMRYAALAVVFYMSTASQQLFILISSMIFMYGLPVGTLLAGDKVKDKLELFKKIVMRYFLFVIIALALFVLVK